MGSRDKFGSARTFIDDSLHNGSMSLIHIFAVRMYDFSAVALEWRSYTLMFFITAGVMVRVVGMSSADPFFVDTESCSSCTTPGATGLCSTNPSVFKFLVVIESDLDEVFAAAVVNITLYVAPWAAVVLVGKLVPFLSCFFMYCGGGGTYRDSVDVVDAVP